MNGAAEALVPHGVEHHYAPLALMTGNVVDRHYRQLLKVTLDPEP